MNRRAFIAWLGGTAAGVAAAPYLDLDKLLWIPGEKTIILPPIILPPIIVEPAIGNFLIPLWVTRDVAASWMNNLEFTTLTNHTYGDLHGYDDRRIKIRRPPRFAS